MADDVAGRIKLLLAERGWSAAELTRRAGLSSPTHIATLLRRGSSRAGSDTLRKIASGAGVSLHWLVTGEGALGVDGTLASRVAWILESCRDAGGNRWSARSLSAAAGLAPPHVGMISRGTVKDVRADTVAAIARAAGVSVEWLATGAATPFASSAPKVDGWAAVVAVDRGDHPDITDDEAAAAGLAAEALLRRPAVPGDLWKIVAFARGLHDLGHLAQVIRQLDARLRAPPGSASGP